MHPFKSALSGLHTTSSMFALKAAVAMFVLALSGSLVRADIGIISPLRP